MEAGVRGGDQPGHGGAVVRQHGPVQVHRPDGHRGHRSHGRILWLRPPQQGARCDGILGVYIETRHFCKLPASLLLDMANLEFTSSSYMVCSVCGHGLTQAPLSVLSLPGCLDWMKPTKRLNFPCFSHCTSSRRQGFSSASGMALHACCCRLPLENLKISEIKSARLYPLCPVSAG